MEFLAGDYICALEWMKNFFFKPKESFNFYFSLLKLMVIFLKRHCYSGTRKPGKKIQCISVYLINDLNQTINLFILLL